MLPLQLKGKGYGPYACWLAGHYGITVGIL